MPTIRLGATFLILGIAISACGSSTGTTPVKAGGAYPTGPDDVVLRVDSCCGYTSFEYQLGLVPTATIYGDGRTIVNGPVTEQYPPHALPNLLTGHVDRDTLVGLLRRAATGGLLEPIDFGQPGITDNPTTTVIINDGTEHRQRIYALGAGTEDRAEPEDPGGPHSFGLSESQIDARRRVQDFIGAVTDAATRDATEPYLATEVSVYLRPAIEAPVDELPAPGRALWPLGPLAGFGDALESNESYRCGVLTGADASAALAAAATATSITRWQSSGAEYTIVWRPLLPDEHACPETSRALGAAAGG